MSKFYKLNIKPLSVNKAWKGRRYATKESKSYQKELLLLLPPKIDIPAGRLEITFEFGMSMASDYDNPIKIFQDVLCKKYGFNDNRIFAAHQYKILVPKGEEFIRFEIKSF
jgi:Holliday junction resolvase RusA-like endonuclease